jgi:hypothetical protein
MSKIIRPYVTNDQFAGLLNALLVKSRKKEFTCFVDNCEEKAIDSHILQKNGVLKYLIEDGHLMILANDFFKRIFHFKRLGADKAFTFKGFCSLHDNQIFKSIESTYFNLREYNNQLLISYRGILNEIRKKQAELYFLQLIKEDSTLYYQVPMDFQVFRKKGLEMGVKDLEFYKGKIEDELRQPKNIFKFIIRELVNAPICTSSLFSWETNSEMLKDIGTIEFYKPLDTIIINIIPQKDKSYLLMGTLDVCDYTCHAFLEYLKSLSMEELLKEVNDILFRNIETWVTSESFYKRKVKQHSLYINNFIHKYAGEFGMEIKVDINIFN